MAAADVVSAIATAAALCPGSQAIAPVVRHALASPKPANPPPASCAAERGLPSLSASEAAGAADAVADECGLNDGQRAVLQAAAAWFGPAEQSGSPALLVHGAFGAGKSTLVAALVLLLSRILRPDAGRPPLGRVLLAASTNTAVDNVLLGLLRREFRDFSRLGSVRRIARPVLPYVLQNDDSAEAAKRLAADLAEASGAGSATQHGSSGDRAPGGGASPCPASDTVDPAQLTEAMARARRGQSARARLSSSFLVATTCAASSFPLLEGERFDIVLLDESSQMPEPLSLLPLARFGAWRFVALGDPKQLPPTLPSPPLALSGSWGVAARDPANVPAEVTAFERLADGPDASPIHMLRVQYRCHPSIAGIASTIFYGGRVRSGLKAASRAPLLRPLGPVSFLDTEAACSGAPGPASSGRPPSADESAGRSLRNAGEAAVCAELVSHLVCSCGLEPRQVGVICLYKAQAAAISASLAGAATVVADRAARATRAASLVAEEAGAAGDLETAREAELEVDACSLRAARCKLLGEVQVSTVDAFQGAERDVIIVATTRTAVPAGSSGALAFLDDARRTNVAITRARHHLVVAGVPRVIHAAKHWSRIARAAERSGLPWAVAVPARAWGAWQLAATSPPAEVPLAAMGGRTERASASSETTVQTEAGAGRAAAASLGGASPESVPDEAWPREDEQDGSSPLSPAAVDKDRDDEDDEDDHGGGTGADDDDDDDDDEDDDDDDFESTLGSGITDRVAAQALEAAAARARPEAAAPPAKRVSRARQSWAGGDEDFL
ncbi:hypothetical protein FNF27_01717 [Cafeteria roenbergensis]|uniref:AAA+ ATPase domain-containing protein n=1 Tax=Cafeteria roenbergensis TaxID=33653 RepID=A0A5A8EG80_CAFRO|nr:hypothetical protein FNF27_01717 [Cafeteria roenbergensis]